MSVRFSERDRRALILLGVSLVTGAILKFAFRDTSAGVAAVSPSVSRDSIALAQQRLVKLRLTAATAPAREAVLKQASADLADRERGIIQADTAPQAQAGLLEIARRVGKLEQIDVRGGEFGAPKRFGDYGMVYATVTFECHIEQFVNFLADLSQQPELVVPSEERIAAANAKEKTMGVRMVLAGIVSKKLIPEKKGLAAF
jgi:hypothetical protein